MFLWMTYTIISSPASTTGASHSISLVVMKVVCGESFPSNKHFVSWVKFAPYKIIDYGTSFVGTSDGSNKCNSGSFKYSKVRLVSI
jgi:hypothetical protein